MNLFYNNYRVKRQLLSENTITNIALTAILLISPLLWRGAGGEVSAQSNRLWATYYGGTSFDHFYDVAVDASGNTYATGWTQSKNGGIATMGSFQTAHGGGIGANAFLVKFNNNGTRLWGTYYGSKEMTGGTIATSVATDVRGNVYMAGYTQNFSGIASGGFQDTYGGGEFDAFLVKFDSVGNRLWATYYGGEGNEYYVSGNISVAIDIKGNAYLAGYTTSDSGIASPGSFQDTHSVYPYGDNYDAFLVKFDAAGNRLWATYYGGMGTEVTYRVSTDSWGNVYLSGYTGSISGIASPGSFQDTGGTVANPSVPGSMLNTDAFLVKFNSTGNRLWATYYGGKGGNYGSVATDTKGNVYLAGTTNMVNDGGPNQGDRDSSLATPGGFQDTVGGSPNGDGFLVKFDSVGNRLWATYSPGKGRWFEENGGGTIVTSVATDASGNVYITGYTANPYDIASYGFQDTYNGNVDAFLVKFDAAGNRLCATYYGGTEQEGEGIVAIDNSGNPYLAGSTAYGSTTNISTAGSHQNIPGGGVWDGFLVKFTSCSSVKVSATDITCNGACTGTATANPTLGTAPYTYLWNTLPAQTTQTATRLCAGTYTVTVIDATSDTATALAAVAENSTGGYITLSTSASTIKQGESAQLNAGGGTAYQWFPASGLSCTNCANPTATPAKTTDYCVQVSDNNSCTQACITITVDIPCAVFVPSAFSPNADGANNMECAIGNSNCLQPLYFAIYDRWGNNVFVTSDLTTCWDGTYKGKAMDPAVFVYYLTATSTSGETIMQKGNISLIR